MYVVSVYVFAHLKYNERKVWTPHGRIPCESMGIYAKSYMTDSATENIPLS